MIKSLSLSILIHIQLCAIISNSSGNEARWVVLILSIGGTKSGLARVMRGSFMPELLLLQLPPLLTFAGHDLIPTIHLGMCPSAHLNTESS